MFSMDQSYILKRSNIPNSKPPFIYLVSIHSYVLLSIKSIEKLKNCWNKNHLKYFKVNLIYTDFTTLEDYPIQILLL